MDDLQSFAKLIEISLESSQVELRKINKRQYNEYLEVDRGAGLIAGTKKMANGFGAASQGKSNRRNKRVPLRQTEEKPGEQHRRRVPNRQEA